MTLTIGLIGCGRWGTIHHATLMSLKQEGYLDRLIVCDIDATALTLLRPTHTTLPSMRC